MIDDRMPPYNLDAEESVIGSVLVDSEAIYLVIGKLTPNDFYRDKNKWCWEAMLELAGRKVAINQITVAHELGRRDRLEALGGSDYLSNLILNVPTSVHIEYYAQIVKDLSIKRDLIDKADQISQIAYSETSAEMALVKSQNLIDGIKADDFYGGFESLSAINIDAEQMTLEMLKNRGMRGISTGYHLLDKAFGGFAPRNMYLIAARPKIGKSQLQCEMARRMAMQRHHVGIVTLEMSKYELAERFVFAEQEIDIQTLRNQYMDEKKQSELGVDKNEAKILEGYEKTKRLPIHISDKTRQTVGKIRTQAYSLMSKYPLKILFIDHLTLVADEDDLSEVRRLAKISGACKEMAKDFNIPVVALCHINRESEKDRDHRPKMWHLRGSGALEQDADVVMLLYRDVVYDKATAHPNKLEIAIPKQRGGESDIFVNLNYNAGTGLITDGG